jgi:hypothetical protein
VNVPAADRYFSLIEATLRDGLANYAGPVDVDDDRSFAMAWVLPAAADRLGFECSTTPRAARADVKQRFAARAIRFVDGAGHSRSPYSAIAVRTLGLHRTAPTTGTSVVREVFDAWASFRGVSAPLMNQVASPNPDASEALTPRWEVGVLRRVADAQQHDGTFLSRTESDSLEPQWYDELAILHALSCYASESGDQEITAAVRRAVKYHAAETQPDHASTHPWAIAAFLDDPDAIPLADMMLHAAGVQQPRTMDAVSLLLLADALDCGRRRATR